MEDFTCKCVFRGVFYSRRQIKVIECPRANSHANNLFTSKNAQVRGLMFLSACTLDINKWDDMLPQIFKSDTSIGLIVRTAVFGYS